MAQTEGRAFRKCFAAELGGDGTLMALLPGGLHMDAAPERTGGGSGAVPDSPYAVISQLSMPSNRGNDRHRNFVEPSFRILVYGVGRGSAIQEATDRAAKRLDDVLETLRFTATDADGDDFEIRGFYRENGYDDARTDETGTFYTRIGGDYRGFGYYLPPT